MPGCSWAGSRSGSRASIRAGRGGVPGDGRPETPAVYLVGAFGGAAKAVIDAVRRKPDDPPVAVLTRLSGREGPRVRGHGRGLRPGGRRRSGRRSLLRRPVPVLRRQGCQVPRRDNGLSEKENHRLFDTPHVIKMVYLVLLGLGRTLGAGLSEHPRPGRGSCHARPPEAGGVGRRCLSSTNSGHLS